LGHLSIIEKETGELVGSCGINIRDISGRVAYEIGYSFIPKYWGRGYATEVTRTLKDFGFKHNIAEQLISIIHIDNDLSKKVAIKNGMKVIETTTYLDMPVELFGIDKVEWEKERK
jgi:RimJ/RimL family protein N-acetyltransferase